MLEGSALKPLQEWAVMIRSGKVRLRGQRDADKRHVSGSGMIAIAWEDFSSPEGGGPPTTPDTGYVPLEVTYW